ncbi:MAG: hypothetical protein WBS54_13135 [Acidobacteriota bacterium]
MTPETSHAAHSQAGRPASPRTPLLRRRTSGSPLALLLLSSLLLAGGCVSQTRIAYHGAPSAGVHLASVAGPACPPTAAGIWSAPDGTAWGHALLRLYRAGSGPSASARAPDALAYVSPAPGPKRWVVVLPIWGASDYPPKKTIRWLLKGNDGRLTSVLWVQNNRRLLVFDGLARVRTPLELSRQLARSAARIDAAASEVEDLVEWVRRRPDTDQQRIGIVGFSIGAIVGSLIMGRDPRYSAGVFVMVGGDLGEILGSCYGRERQVRDRAMKLFGWSREEYVLKVNEGLSSVDPERVAGDINPASVLYIDARHDGCIPTVSREGLWEAMGRPERITIAYGHKSSFLSMTFLGLDVTTRRIVHFLDRRLAEPAPPVPAADTALKSPAQGP